MFEFYLKVYRSGLITFCGDKFEVDFDINSGDGRFSFREYDNGRFKHRNPVTRHPNILYGIIVGKKGWGLWVKQWSEGIVECSFTKQEILNEFKGRGIEIPEPLMIEWDKLIQKLKHEKYCKLYDEMMSK